jgi:hypothetical protein
MPSQPTNISKFDFNVMCLSLADITSIIKFYKDHCSELSDLGSRKTIENLVSTIEYMDKEYQILSSFPRADSIMYGLAQNSP